MITRTLLTGLLAGLAAGIVLTLLYVGKIQPLILAAESYEQGRDASLSAPFMRYVDTFLFNILHGVGFGMLLAAALTVRGRPAGVARGMLWGAAGFAAFVLAPSAGLPPELPGAIRAPLENRQIWWILTAAATAGGIGLIAFMARLPWKAAGVLLIMLPHIVGPPQATVYGGTLPAELAAAYVGILIGAMALFWIVLGSVAGWCHDRFVYGGAAPAASG
jgi:cobalt transporter subunit CbtA